MKVILLKDQEVSGTTSLWAAAMIQFFALRGARCVHIRQGVTGEDEAQRLIDSAMTPSGVVIVETDGNIMPIEGLVPDYTMTVECHTHWRADVGLAALQTRLAACLAGVDRIDNDRIVTHCLNFNALRWSAHEQARLADALVTLGWTSHQRCPDRLEWSRDSGAHAPAAETA